MGSSHDLYVDQSARRKGVAKALLQMAKDHAAQTGAMGLILETARDNYSAQRLYEANDYKLDNENIYYENLF